LDAAANPGRLNLFRRGERLAMVDFAHNEAGLAGLLDVCRHLVSGDAAGAGKSGKVRLAFGTAGDRSDEILHSLGQMAGREADEVVICEKPHYLRGRDLEAMNAILRRGVADGGYRREVPAYPTELAALEALLSRTRRGDVAAIMAHAERAEIFDWLERNRYQPVAGDELRALLAGRSASAGGA
jgi:cyanophycin synthetase